MFMLDGKQIHNLAMEQAFMEGQTARSNGISRDQNPYRFEIETRDRNGRPDGTGRTYCPTEEQRDEWYLGFDDEES